MHLPRSPGQIVKVLHVIWHLGQGGAQTYLYNLLRLQVADPALEPRLLVLGEEGELSSDFEELLEVSYLRMRGGLDLLRASRIAGALRQSDHRVLHSHSNNLAFNVALQFSRQPVVYTEHGGGLLGGRKRDLLIYRYLARPITRFIAISQEMARVMASANPVLEERIDVVYNGVDIERITATPAIGPEQLDRRITDAKYRVGVIGRLENQKGMDLFVETAASLCATRDDVAFVIIGEGTLRDELERLAGTRGIADRVIFLGFRTDALGLLKCLDLFLFTSNYEPFGLVIVESMVAEVPVVATSSPGAVAEIISSGEDGIIVNSREPARVAAVVNDLLEDEALRARFERAGRESAGRRFTIQSNAQGVKAVYRRCLPEDSLQGR